MLRGQKNAVSIDCEYYVKLIDIAKTTLSQSNKQVECEEYSIMF